MSPDMNPIEHVWDFVSRAIFNRNNPPRSTQELIVAATEEWDNNPQEVINNLIIGMYRCVDALIRSRGGNTNVFNLLPYAPGDIESVVENERCRIYYNYSFPTLELVQANKPDIVLLDHQQKTMFVIEFSAPAEVNIVSKEEEKRTKYQELLEQLRRLCRTTLLVCW
nr:unnamed protein product [Callosobruchus chinensis]